MRLIIEFSDDVPIVDAVESVLVVLKQGKISENSNGPQYCWSTVFQGLKIFNRRAGRTDLKSESFVVLKD